jgi:amino acid permease
LSGGIIRHAEYFVDPALSFANGWNQVYGTMVSLPAEIVAAAVIVDFWSQISNAVWIVVFGVLLVASNLFFVRIYGELEFSFASLKIMLIIGLNIMASQLLSELSTQEANMREGPGNYLWRWSRSSQIWVPILAKPWPLC